MTPLLLYSTETDEQSSSRTGDLNEENRVSTLKKLGDDYVILSNDTTNQEEEEQQQPIRQTTSRYNLRSKENNAFYAYTVFEEAFDTEPDPIQTAFALATVHNEKHPVSMYLPEPQTFRAILDLPPEIRSLWMNSVYSELKNLIIDNETFALEDPTPGEQVIPTRIVNKAKSDPHGNMSKLKCRIVARGDLQKEK